MDYTIYKGILKPIEFKGLRSTYIVIAGAGLLVGMLLSYVLNVIFGVLIILLSLFVSIYLNSKFGTKGLQLYFAKKKCVGYIMNNRRVCNIIKHSEKK